MKKNLVPLVGIALVVAVISTVIFYSLIASRMTGVQAKVTPLAASAPSRTASVPPGMRAVSVQVADSSGILALLKPGDRVDIQAVYTRTGQVVDSELKTVLENIEVLSASSKAEPSPGKATLPVVTFLTAPAEADVLALADSAARIRLALRHPEDTGKEARSGLALPSFAKGSRAPAVRTPAPQATQSISPAAAPAAGSCAQPAPALNSITH